MSDPKLEALGRVPLFSKCSRKELEFIASRTDEVELAAGRHLIDLGEPNDTFFVLLDGEVEVQPAGRPSRLLGPGDFFGEISMLDRGPATADVLVKAPSRLMVMSHSQFQDAIKTNGTLLTQVLAAVAERLRDDELGAR